MKELDSVGFLEKSRWAGKVAVVLLDSSPPRIGVLLVIGQRSIQLPRRGLATIASCLAWASRTADMRYKELLKSMNEREER